MKGLKVMEIDLRHPQDYPWKFASGSVDVSLVNKPKIRNKDVEGNLSYHENALTLPGFQQSI